MENKKRLIDADAQIATIKETVCKNCNSYNGIRCEACWVDDTIAFLEDSPTVDAVEVVHAHWEDGCAVDCYGNIAYKSIDCSHCEEIFKIESRTREYWKERFKVCPFCGAKMDLED